MTTPRYQEVKAADIPVVTDDDGTRARVVCGSFWGVTGPVEGVAADPVYLDVSLLPEVRKTLPVETTRHAFAYVFSGSANSATLRGRLPSPLSRRAGPTRSLPRKPTTAPWCSSTAATRSRCRRARRGCGFCWYPGRPLREPVAWYGPIVMNTQEELRHAFLELERGTFLKHAKPS